MAFGESGCLVERTAETYLCKDQAWNTGYDLYKVRATNCHTVGCGQNADYDEQEERCVPCTQDQVYDEATQRCKVEAAGTGGNGPPLAYDTTEEFQGADYHVSLPANNGIEPSLTGPGYERIYERAECNESVEWRVAHADSSLEKCAVECCLDSNCTVISFGDGKCYKEYTWRNRWQCDKALPKPSYDVYKVRSDKCSEIEVYRRPPVSPTGFELIARNRVCSEDVGNPTPRGFELFHGQGKDARACARAVCEYHWRTSHLGVGATIMAFGESGCLVERTAEA